MDTGNIVIFKYVCVVRWRPEKDRNKNLFSEVIKCQIT